MDNNVIKELYNIILERKNGGDEGSYTAYLFSKGKEKILKKVGEECTEVVIASLGENREEQVSEISDLTYHLLVLMAELGLTIEDVESELKRRRDKIGNLKGERKEIEKL